jgi:uncharacterized protein YkwD
VRPPRLTRPARWRLCGPIAAIALAIAAPAHAGTGAGIAFDAELAAAVGAAIGDVRASEGAAPLRSAPGLVRSARAHAISMARLGYFSHTSADGTSQNRRITSYYQVEGAVDWGVGEVLFWGSPRASARAVVSAWLASAPHARELSRPWRELGVAALRVARAPGVFGGRAVTIVVVDFGRR